MILLTIYSETHAVQSTPNEDQVPISPVSPRKTVSSNMYQILPGLMLKVLFRDDQEPIELSVQSLGEDEARDLSLSGRHKKNYGHYLQIALPFAVLPFILFSSFLPFLIPVLKLGTIFATMVNNSALLASLMFLIRQIALENEQKQTIYFNPGYNH